MIKAVEMYYVECDNCHISSTENGEFSAYGDKSYAIEDAQEQGWTEHEGKHYCPDCYEWDDDDMIQIKNLKTETP